MAEVSPERAHVADLDRSDGTRSFEQSGELSPDNLGFFQVTVKYQRAETQPLALGQKTELGDFGNIDEMLGLNSPYFHLHEQVRSPGEDPCGGPMGLQEGNRLSQTPGLVVGKFLG
jgi:hypothetical protein